MDAKSKALLLDHLLRYAKNKHNKPLFGTAQLSYYIWEGVLTGVFGTEQICVTVWSGGGGGAKKAKPNENTNNPYMYALKQVKDKHGKPIVRGGPIPPGPWRVHRPGPHKGYKKIVCVLEPQFKLPNDRRDFLIHSQGDLGSDGCIVLPDAVFDEVMDKLKKSAGGHLEVCQAMDGSVFA